MHNRISKFRLLSSLSIITLTLFLNGCNNINANSDNDSSDNGNSTQKSSTSIQLTSSDKETLGEIDTYINLEDNINIKGDGATSENNIITISSGGTYSISGTLDDGQIIVNTSKEEKVYLLLDNANITCSNSAPIYIKQADKAIIALADDTNNSITDGSNYELEDESSDEPNATIFSKDDLIFIGNGSLTVKSNYNDAIASKDDLIIQSGNIDIESVGDGIRGKDSVHIVDGNINIVASQDGIKSTNTEDTSKGYVWIEDGTINIESTQDGIQGESLVGISNGNISITTGGGSENSSNTNSWGNWGKDGGPMEQNNSTSSDTDTTSAKALKCENKIIIDNGKINIDSSDDSIHSNDTVYINNGDINISSGDDGIHSDSLLEFYGGDIDIEKSYEGLESLVITINDGNININASDDGLNSAGGSDGSSTDRPGANEFATVEGAEINFNGGYVYVISDGDGIDSNGNINMTAGTVLVDGPTNGGNGSLDFNGEFKIDGGLLVATGSLGMAETPSDTSSQNCVSISLSSQQAKSIIHIEDNEGNNILTYSPSKNYQSVIVSSPDLEENVSYSVYTGGSSTGDKTDGLYSSGSYTDGTKLDDFTISSIITKIGDATSQVGGSRDNPNQNMNTPEPPQQ